MKKFLFLPLLLSCLNAYAYQADITLDKDAKAVVKENILLLAPALSFTRVLPLYYTNSLGFQEKNGLKVLSARAEGHEVPLTQNKNLQDRNISVSFEGNNPAEEFEIEYSTQGLVRYFAKADEIHFSPFEYPVNGMDASSFTLTLTLPGEYETIKLFAGETGNKKEIDAQYGVKDGKVFITAHYAQNIEAVIYMPKGTFSSLSITEEAEGFFLSDKKILAGTSVLLGLLIYYIAVWLYLGVYNKKNIPPSDGKKIPHNLTPAQMRFMYKKVPGQVSDKFKILSSSILGLATRGFVTIEKKGHEYLITKTAKKATAEEDQFIIKMLFKYGDVFNAKEQTSKDMLFIVKKFRDFLDRNLRPKYSARNALWRAAGYIVAVLYIVWAFFYMYDESPVYFYFLFGAAAFISIFFTTLFNPFNKKGRAVMRDIESFRKFLMTEETVPERQDAIALFEKYLPYALALGVENKWCRKFSAEIKPALITCYKSETFTNSPSYAATLSAETGSEFTTSFYFTSLRG